MLQEKKSAATPKFLLVNPQTNEAFMDVRHLKKLIKIVEQSEINELEIEDGGSRVKIVKNPPGVAFLAGNPQVAAPLAALPQASEQVPASPEAFDRSPFVKEKKEKTNLVEIAAPMVGTFYRAPSPGATPFVEVGDHIKLGQTLCILEAMKLMNELECEVPGIIREICVENAQPVEFGHRLFLIEPEE